MNQTFSVGEIAILQNLAQPFSHENGDECEVIGPLALRTGDLPGGTVFRGPCYRIRHDGAPWLVQPHCLRKKRPPRDAWKRIEEITSWRPNKRTVRA